MLEPVLLTRFKRTTREDELIGQALAQHLDVKDGACILDVGAGTGLVSRTLMQLRAPNAVLSVVEPLSSFTFPDSVQVFRRPFERLRLRQRFSLILMSHVIGHFPRDRREQQIIRACNLLGPEGTLVIIENAPSPPFWPLNLDVGLRQGGDYVIDFDRLEKTIRQVADVALIEATIPLTMGETESDALRLMNIFFPKPFSAADERRVRAHWHDLFNGDGFKLRLKQRFYFIRPPNCDCRAIRSPAPPSGDHRHRRRESVPLTHFH